MKQKIALLLVFFLIGVFFAQPVLAHHKKDVLGESSDASEIVFPPVAAGPGYFLPDSPMYVFDKVFQSLRLAVAFTPERRVVVRNQILGERLSELRVMTERNNEYAMQSTLNEIGMESGKIAADLSDAASRGRDVSQLAKDSNDMMKLYRDILGAAGEHADEVMALEFEATRQAVLLAKVEVEDQLTEQQLAEAIESDLEDEIETQVLGANKRVERLERRLQRLDTLQGIVEQEELKREMRANKNKGKKKVKNTQKDIRKLRMQEARLKAQELKAKIQELRNARKAEKDGSLFPILPQTSPETPAVTE